jgi:ABC-type transport system involved in multi-copper enzyme maturation permease subunit
MTAALGLLLSTLVSRAFSVILLSYGFMLFIWVFVPTIVAMLMFGVMRTPPGAVQPTVALASVTHPSFALALVVVPDMPPAGTLRWPWCVLFHLALAGAMVLLSAVLLRRMARKENEGVAPQAPAPVGAAAKGEELADHNGGTAAGAGARPPPAPAPPQVSDNPVLWRELRQPLMARRWQARAASLAVLGMLALLYVLLAASGGSRHSPLADPEPQIGFAVIFCALLNLLMCVVSATAIAHEKESDTWALLLATPLSGRQIVWGKLAGLAKRLMWPSVLIVGHFLVFTVFGVINLTTLCIVLWMTFATNVIWLATGLYLSLRLKTVTFAAILNLLLVALLYGGVAIVVGILGAVLAGQENWAEVVGLYAPYAYMGTAIERLNRSGNAVWAHRLWMPLLGQVSWGEFSGWVIKAGCAHLAATALVLWHTIRHFDRIVGRAAQVEAGYGRAGFWQEGRTFGL